MGTTNILDLNNRVDELEKSYPASQVMMSDGVTSVEDALEVARERIGTNINLTKVGSLVQLNIPDGAYNTDTNGYVLYDGSQLVLPKKYRPHTNTTFLEAYAGRRVIVEITGKIQVLNMASQTDMLLRFNALWFS